MIGPHVRYPRWIVYDPANPASLAATVTGALSAPQAKRVTDVLVRIYGRVLVVRMEHHGGRTNPTLVHHGLAPWARWHVTTRQGVPIADLYDALEPMPASRVTTEIATDLGVPLLLMSNTGLPPTIGEHGVVRGSRGEFEHRPRSRNPGRSSKKFVNAYSIAVGLGYPYLRGEGRVAADGVTWLSRATKTSSGTGPAVFVGFHPKTGKVVIEYENPSRSRVARARRRQTRRVIGGRRVRRAAATWTSPVGAAKIRHYEAEHLSRVRRRARGNPCTPIDEALADWRSRRAYLDNAGNYRLCDPQGRTLE